MQNGERLKYPKKNSRTFDSLGRCIHVERTIIETVAELLEHMGGEFS
jgi:hypothetical protein